MHACSNCGQSFDPALARPQELSWKTLFTRPNKAFPLGEDINTFDLVKCPRCGHTERAPELKVFGVIPGSNIKLVLGGLLLVILVFGYWLVQFASQ
jgi:hypothetical protein